MTGAAEPDGSTAFGAAGFNSAGFSATTFGFLAGLFFVYRSFYGMRIIDDAATAGIKAKRATAK